MNQKNNSGIFQLNQLFRQANFQLLGIDFQSLTQILNSNPQEIQKQVKELQQEVNLFFNRFDFYIKNIKKELTKIKRNDAREIQESKTNLIEISISNPKQQKLKIKQQKKLSKKPVIQENYSDLFCISAEFVSFANQSIKVAYYEKICQTVFDSYSILNLKIPNMLNNKDLFEKILLLTWKLLRQQGQQTIQYENCQSVIGIPEVFPFTYSKKGSLMKKFRNDQEQPQAKKQGLFTDERVEREFERILIKIQEQSSNLFEQISEQKTNLIYDENQQEYTHHQIYVSAKNMILKKISLFKINYLSTLLIKFIQNQKIDNQNVNQLINIELLQRPRIKNHIEQWIKNIQQVKF